MEIQNAEDNGSTYCEAEYYAASTAGSEVLYLGKLLERMGFAQASATPVYGDKTACIVAIY